MDTSEPNTHAIDPNRLLNLAEVCSVLRVSVNTIYPWIRDGKLPAIRVGKEWRVKRSDLDGWLDGQRNVEVPA